MDKQICETLRLDQNQVLAKLADVPPEQLLIAVSECYDPENVTIQENIFLVCERLLLGKAESWLRTTTYLPVQNFAFDAYCSALNVCNKQDGFEIAIAKLKNEMDSQLAYFAHGLLAFDDKTRIVDWIENRLVADNLPVKPDWGQLAALAGVPWKRIDQWLTQCKPLNLVALDAIVAWLTEHVDQGCWLRAYTPKILETPSKDSMKRLLNALAESNGTPRVARTVEQINSLLS